jgi:transposase-like protein
MKIKLMVCQRCGHEQRVKIYDREEAEREGFPLARPRCEKCGSLDVKLYD